MTGDDNFTPYGKSLYQIYESMHGEEMFNVDVELIQLVMLNFISAQWNDSKFSTIYFNIKNSLFKISDEYPSLTADCISDIISFLYKSNSNAIYSTMEIILSVQTNDHSLVAKIMIGLLKIGFVHQVNGGFQVSPYVIDAKKQLLNSN